MAGRPIGGSGAGWSSRGTGADPGEADGEGNVPEDHPFRAAEGARYDPLDVLGVGGMGTVYAAQDRRLGREVALKVFATDDDVDADDRGAREAQITARLEHPGIVPVHDAGVGADGRLFYTMRLVRGRSLVVAFLDAVDLPMRLGLLRHVLAAVHAVGFAHARGVIHRDLKPANVMVGEHGETVVVDWGVAVDRDGPPARPGAGTPAYMAPEQARGESPSPTDDVWSLGAILYELLRGQPLSRMTTVAEAGVGARPDLLALRRARVPLELIAIVDKALAARPEARFADARALARDLEAYLDGRRVGAHAYTPLELVTRLARLWRVPLLVGGIGIVIVAVVFGLTWRRVLRERGRAVVAEASTREALVVAQANLVTAIESHAASAFDEDARPEAELLAVRALSITASPTARGVLAAGGARPISATRSVVAGCTKVLAERDGKVVCLDGAELSVRAQADGAVVWKRSWPTSTAVLLDDGRVGVLGATNGAAVLAAATGEVEVDAPEVVAARDLARSPDGRWLAGVTAAHDITLIDLEARRSTAQGRICTPANLEAFALGPATLLVACSDARLLMRSLTTSAPPAWRTFDIAPATSSVTALAVDRSGTRAVSGSVDGAIRAIDLGSGALGARLVVTTGAIKRLAFVGDRLLVTPDRGGAMVWDLDHGVEVLRLPRGDRRYVGAGATEIVGLGTGSWRWRLPVELAPWRLTAPAGLGSAAVSPDGRLLAVGRGDGHVTVWSRSDGRRIADLELSARVIKRLAFAPDGRILAAAVAGPEAVQLIDVATWRATPLAESTASRRVAYLRDGTLVAAPYADGIDVWRDGNHQRVLGELRVRDAYVAPDTELLWILTQEDRVIRWRAAGHEIVVTAPGARGLTASRDGTRIVTSYPDGARVHDIATGASAWVACTSGEVTEVTLTADGRWLVMGTVTGRTEVREAANGTLVAILRGHRERLAESALAPDGQLITSSWDGTALSWDLKTLTTPAETLNASTLARWGDGIAELSAP